MPERIQRKRTKGWKMPANAVFVGRTRRDFPGPFANPFRVGGYFKIGRGEGHGGFMWLESHPDYADDTFNLIADNDQAVNFYRLYRRLYPFKAEQIEKLRDKDLACWCRLDQPCHADVLLQIANVPQPAPVVGTPTKP